MQDGKRAWRVTGLTGLILKVIPLKLFLDRLRFQKSQAEDVEKNYSYDADFGYVDSTIGL